MLKNKKIILKNDKIMLKNNKTMMKNNIVNESNWQVQKIIILGLSLEDKRKLYNRMYLCKIEYIYTWASYYHLSRSIKSSKYSPIKFDLKHFKMKIDESKNRELASKVSLVYGDITKLEIDAIVNAANSRLIAGGGVDGAIHRAAGPMLQEECNSLHGCPTGTAKITGGYNLPAKFVIHTVGPRDGNPKDLQSCYEQSLAYHHEYRVKSIAFPCIATGIYGFPNRLAAHIALRTARKFLEENEEMERIIFCTFMPVDVDIYKTLLQMYFPVHAGNYAASD